MILVRHVNASGKGPVQQEQRRLSGSAFTVGRSAKCQIQLADAGVALDHARITLLPGIATIAAEGGPVLVNGRKTQSSPISVGDRIQIGPYLIRAEDPAPGLELELVVSRTVAPSRATVWPRGNGSRGERKTPTNPPSKKVPPSVSSVSVAGPVRVTRWVGLASDSSVKEWRSPGRRTARRALA